MQHAKVWGWVLAILGGAGLAASVGLFVWLGLDKGNQLAGILSFFVGLLALAVAVYGVVLARRNQTTDTPLVHNSSVGGVAYDLQGVRRNVKIRRTSRTPVPPPLPSGTPGAAPSDAMVTNSWIGGSVRRIRDVDGDVEITE